MAMRLRAAPPVLAPLLPPVGVLVLAGAPRPAGAETKLKSSSMFVCYEQPKQHREIMTCTRRSKERAFGVEC